MLAALLIVAFAVGMLFLFRTKGFSPVSGKYSEHFGESDFRSVHAGIVTEVPSEFHGNAVKLANALEKLRASLSAKAGKDVPLYCNCAFRTLAQNRSNPGRARHSLHTVCLAADVHSNVFSPTEIAEAANGLVIFGFIEVHDTFTHVDIGPRGYADRVALVNSELSKIGETV